MRPIPEQTSEGYLTGEAPLMPERWIGRRVVGNWVAVEELGAGTSAVVYRAESPDFERPLALKVIDLDAPLHRTRSETRSVVRREVDTVSQLRNPHIVRIYNVREVGDRYMAILMDYVDAPTMRQIVDLHGAMARERAIELIRQVADGLWEAHRCGIVHRDIKPENLLVERLPCGADFVRITDFGLASPAQRIPERDSFVGTPLWASPEQVLGRSLGLASDIYSVGTLLFYLLTGQAPFTSTDPKEILRAHVAEPAPRLADKSERNFPPELEALIADLLDKRPTERPRSLIALIDRLDEVTELATGRRLQEPSPMPGVSTVSENGQVIAVAGRGSGIAIFSDGSGRPVTHIALDDVVALSLSEDGHLLATLTRDGDAAVWGVETGRQFYQVGSVAGDILSLHFSRSSLLGICDTGEQILVVDLQSG